MKTNQFVFPAKLSIAPLLAMLMLFTSSFSALAMSTPVTSGCAQADIPSTRLDYMALNDPSLCPVVGAASINLIPNTGAAASTDRYRAFKEQQADLASGGNTSSIQLQAGYMDRSFADFKLRQSEERSH